MNTFLWLESFLMFLTARYLQNGMMRRRLGGSECRRTVF